MRTPIHERFDAMVGLQPEDALGQIAFGSVKKTYCMCGGRLEETETKPLRHDLWESPRDIPCGSDFLPFKSFADVVVEGNAYARRGQTSRTVSLRVGSVRKRVQVFGPRTARERDGRVVFDAPEPFEHVPLDARFAYGGVDRRVPIDRPMTFETQLLLVADHPGAYPRNPNGRGYVVLPLGDAEVALPQLEDPDRLLTPERLIVGDPRRWYEMPLPWCLDWRRLAMFPRFRAFGAEAWYPVPDRVRLEEVERGLIPADWRSASGSLDRPAPLAPWQRQEASLGMYFASLEQGIEIELVGMHPEQDTQVFRLPTFPKLAIDVEGDRVEVAPRIQHIVITPHEERVEITWGGIRETIPRPFFVGVHGKIPVTLEVDGAPVPFEAPEPVYPKIRAARKAGRLEDRPVRRRADQPEVPGRFETLRPNRHRDQASAAPWIDADRAVDPLTGRVVRREVDLELEAPVLFAFRRHYSSSLAWRAGALGPGWSHSLEQEVWLEPGWLLYRMEDGREIGMPLRGSELAVGEPLHHPGAGVTVRLVAKGAYEVHTTEGMRYGFVRRDRSARDDGRPARARLTRIWGPDGSQLEVRYDREGRPHRVLSSGVLLLELEHDAAGRLTGLGRPRASDGAVASVTRYEHTASGHLARAVDGVGRTTRYAYASRLLTEVAEPTGRTRRFAYDGTTFEARCREEVCDVEAGAVRRHGYAAKNNRASVGLATGGSIPVTLDASFRATGLVDGGGRQTLRELDEVSGAPVAERCDGREQRALYDATDHLAEIVVSGRGHVRFDHDAEGRLLERTGAAGGGYRYDERGRLVVVTGPNGASTLYDHASGEALASVLLPGEVRLDLERGEGGAIEGVISSFGARRAERDRALRVRRIVDEMGHVETYAYDPAGRVQRRESEVVRCDYECDAEGRLTRLFDGATDLRLERDHAGLVVGITEGDEGPRVHRDAEGRVTMVESELIGLAQLEREPDGGLASVVDLGGRRRVRLRDERGFVTRRIGPSTRIELDRDVAGRPIRVAHADGSYQTLGFGGDGRIATAQDADRVVALRHDQAGRLVHEHGPYGAVRSRYDAVGQRVEATSTCGLALHVRRDAVGGLLSSSVSVGAARLPLTAERDALGRERVRHLPGGVEVLWKHDALGRVVERVVRRDAQTLDRCTYEWAGVDRCVKTTANGRARAHRHDRRGRLIEAGGITRVLDPVGRAYASEALDDAQYRDDGAVIERFGSRYVYDEEGRRTSRTDALGDETRYVWDGAGRLTEVWLPDGRRVVFTYDALGRRVLRRTERRVEVPGVDEPAWEASRETRYVWDGLTLLHEMEGDVVTTWLWEAGELVGLLRGGDAYAVVTDPLGVPSFVVDQRGEIVFQASMDMLGEMKLGVAQVACPWRFPGHYEDADTGLMHAWLRVYDPETGLYLTPSPLGVAAGSNAYAYVDDPLSESSPLGLGAGYAALQGAMAGEELEAELLERWIAALDRRDGAAGPPARFVPIEPALPDPEARLFGRWSEVRPEVIWPKPVRIPVLPGEDWLPSEG